MELQGLNNPNKINGICHSNGTNYECGDNQAFQETENRYEIWEKSSNGLLYKVAGFNKKSVVCTY